MTPPQGIMAGLLIPGLGSTCPQLPQPAVSSPYPAPWEWGGEAGAETGGPHTAPACPGTGHQTCLPLEESGVTPAMPSGVQGKWPGQQI